MRLTVCLAALAATLVAATPAAAAVTRTAVADAKGLVLSPLSLEKKSDLDFGTVATSATAGSVAINADTGVRTAGGPAGAVTLVPSTFSRAQFDGLGNPNSVVTLTLTPPTGNVLINGANTVTVNSMAVDNGNTLTRTIPASGSFTVYVGADFAIAANQANGAYTAPFTLTADYQ